MRMDLAYYLFNDDDEGFNRACERLFKTKQATSEEASNINKEGSRFSRMPPGDDWEL